MISHAIKNKLARAADKLKKINPQYFYQEAQDLLAFVLNKNKTYLFACPEKILTSQESKRLNTLIQKRLNNIPLAYLLGFQEFYGLKFLVNKNVLIPRPETELIIDNLKLIINNPQKNYLIIDVGTGSGCIIIALAKILNLKNIKFIAIDNSRKALNIARKNAKLNQVNKKIKFLESNLLEKILDNKKLLINNNIIITANLPYLTKKQVEISQSIQAEPKSALIGGSDGLKYYRELFSQIKNLRSKNKTASLKIICEIDPSQDNKLKKIILKNFPKAKIKLQKDLSGKIRFLLANF